MSLLKRSKPESWEIRITVQLILDGELVQGKQSTISSVDGSPVTKAETLADARLEAGRLLHNLIVEAAEKGKLP